MPPRIYSHSRLSTFEQCPLKFKYKYIDKIFIEVEKTIEAHLGACIHHALEWIYLEVKHGKLPSIDDFIMTYSNQWRKEYVPAMIIVDTSMTAKDFFNKGVQFLLDYYSKHYPFDDGTIELEKEIRIKLDETGEYEIIGFIDRLAKNIQTGEYEIHDYKTANSLPTQERVDNDRQLALYAIAIKEIYGKNEEVCLIWHYLAHNKRICSRRTNEQLHQLKQETFELIKKIEATTEFQSNKGRLCDWCEYKQMCKEWNTSEENIQNQVKDIKVDTKKYPTISKYIKD